MEESTTEKPSIAVMHNLMERSHVYSIRECLFVLYQLCVDETPDYQFLAKRLEYAYEEEVKEIVNFQNYLEPFLKVDCVLRDYLIKGQLLNAVHELERLHAIATTGKDPDVVEEPIVYCANCEVKPVKRIRNS